MYDALYAMLNKSENATLQYFIFSEKVLDEKYLLKINNQQAIRRNSTNVSLLMFELCSLFTEFCNCACAKKIVMRIRILHLCCKKTILSLETSSEINFELIKFVKKKWKMSPFDKKK